MSRKTTAALVAVLAVNFTVAGAALMLANLNKPAEYDADAALDAKYSDLNQVAGVKVNAEAGDLAVPLKAAQQGGNTRVTFACGKSISGGREVHEGTWDQIAGAVLYRSDGQKLLAVEAVFDTRSLRTDANALTATVTTKEKWFDIDNHPTATFRCKDVVSNDAATPSHTHVMQGEFTLNGITKPLTIPAKLSFSGQSLTIDASFTILRSEYDVERRESSLAGTIGGVVSEVEDEVVLSVRVTASPDPSAVISDLAQVVEQQQEAIRKAKLEIDQLKPYGRQIELLEEQVERFASRGPERQESIDLASLPKTFTDHSVGYDGAYPFQMVLVPGDAGQGIEPFYMAEHEVAWGMVDEWMYSHDLPDDAIALISRLREEGLRPTPLYGDPTATIQYNEKSNPAMAMSLLTARAYCKWLSEKTGRRYRLPTIQEWRHALELGGGVPAELDSVAWHANNSPVREDSLVQLTSPVKQKKPNAIGLYDMLGGVAEWVTNTGADRVVVGGSIFTDPAEMNADWRAVEDVAVWSESYPNFPKSRYWYSDFYMTGIRLVCEPSSVAAKPPKAGE